MGAVKRDMHAGERRLSERYALDSATGVKLLLSEYHALQARQYQGDVDAIILLADLETAISTAGLTDRQRQALNLVYVEDLTQAKAGEAMGLDKPGVNNLLDRAIDAITEIYYYWSRHGEGYETTITKEGAE
jgi:DNA-directed RNA polymerase specialized sigma24 family protein